MCMERIPKHKTVPKVSIPGVTTSEVINIILGPSPGTHVSHPDTVSVLGSTSIVSVPKCTASVRFLILHQQPQHFSDNPFQNFIPILAIWEIKRSKRNFFDD